MKFRETVSKDLRAGLPEISAWAPSDSRNLGRRMTPNVPAMIVSLRTKLDNSHNLWVVSRRRSSGFRKTRWDIELTDLIEGARNGNSQSLNDLLDLIRPYVVTMARFHVDRRFRQRVDASDLAQETLVQCYQDFDQFRGHSQAELTAWVRRILSHTVIDLVIRHHGAQKRDVRMETSIHREIDESSVCLEQLVIYAGPSPSEVAESREQSVAVAVALETLPPHYRDVLVYRHLHQLPFREVAQRMNRSLDSVEKLWVRSLRQLRRYLDNGHA